jgi:hypothetical protein
MREPQYVGVCCYRYRAITYNRCTDCKPEYGCPLFKSPAELVVFYRLIPPSMLGAPLPLNLWPNLWRTIEPSTPARGESPVQLLAAALGLANPVAFPSPPTPERALNEHSQEI